MKKKQPKWKPIKMGDRLPCWSFIRKMDGTVLPLTTIGGAFSGQDAYYLPVKDVIEIIKDFPKEESEDERICGQLIAFLKQSKAVYGDGFKQFGLNIDDALAWLEKQSMQKQELLTKEKALKNSPFVEQKPVNSIWHEMTENPEGDENDRTLVVFEDGYSTTSNALLHIGFGTSKPYRWAYVNDILRLTSNTKQSEQKPVIVPKFKVGDIVKDIEDGEVFTIRTVTKDKYIYTDDSFDWIKDQDVYELVEQKPTEWSHIDENRINNICDFIQGHTNFADSAKEAAVVFLKSLKDRVQPQPQSDERNRLLGKLEEWLDEYVSNLADVDTATLICSFTNYLDGKLPKSLRPQNTWRPSEEQIKALENVTYYSSFPDAKYCVDLKRLLEQLKAL